MVKMTKHITMEGDETPLKLNQAFDFNVSSMKDGDKDKDSDAAHALISFASAHQRVTRIEDTEDKCIFRTKSFKSLHEAETYLKQSASQEDEDTHIGCVLSDDTFVVYTSLKNHPFRLDEWEAQVGRIKWHTIKAYVRRHQQYGTLRVVDAPQTIHKSSKGLTRRSFKHKLGLTVKLNHRSCKALNVCNFEKCRNCQYPSWQRRCTKGKEFFLIDD